MFNKFRSPSILIGKTIKSIVVTGYNVEIEAEDGFKFNYDASDGGYSSWDCYKEESGK